MLAQKTGKSEAGRYVSDRVYNGTRPISKKDSDVNRRAVNDAFARMEHGHEREEVARVAS